MKSTKTANPGVNTKEAFCESFAWEKIEFGIEWFDLVGLSTLEKGNVGEPKRLARLELAERGSPGNYTGFFVTIINTITGPIDSKLFLFADYLDRANAKDIRNGGKGSNMPMPGVVLQVKREDSGDFFWYLLEPKDTTPFCEAIAGYVRSFEDQ